MKKPSIKVTPSYLPLTQQRLCCVPCAVQWILLRRKLPIFTQEEIGRALKLVVPPKYKHLFPKGIKVSAKKPLLGYGCQDSDKAGPFNRFFRNKKIPLHVTYYKRSATEDPANLIRTSLKKGHDVMIITFMSALDKKKKFGHALLVSKISNGIKPKVTVGDPDFFSPKFYQVLLPTLLKGMSAKIGKVERGIYIFAKN